MSNHFNGAINKRNLQNAYLHLKAVLKSEDFLTNQNLIKEVPFHICPYDPAVQDDMLQLVRQLSNDLFEDDIKVLEINIYDLAIEILKDEGDWSWILQKEQTLSRDELKDELQGMLDVENVITPAIHEKMKSNMFEVLLLTGVGEVFPYIRSHNILNNLQRIAKEKPTLIFFPGDYKHSLESGASLVLFGKLQDDKYYRAFNILDRAV